MSELTIIDLVDNIDQVQDLYSKKIRDIQKSFDLTGSAITIIHVLQDRELNLTELTEEIDLDKSTISRQLKAMEKKELLNRKTGDDKRFSYYAVSPKGRRQYLAYLKAVEKHFSKVFEPWTGEEMQLLYVLLGRLHRSLHNMQVA